MRCGLLGAKFIASQGAAAAAGRVLKVMEKRGLIEHVVRTHDWGYMLTGSGRVAAQELENDQ